MDDLAGRFATLLASRGVEKDDRVAVYTQNGPQFLVATHPQVREAAVVGIADEYRGETVAAFVALKEGDEVLEDDPISYCKERMANYKYPRQIEFLDEIPKTATGKFLRRELRDEARAEA